MGVLRSYGWCGLVVTYDEVLRFYKSSAKVFGENPDIFNKFMGLDVNVGALSGWYDNLDLQLCTPSGKKNTHAMIHQFQQSNPQREIVQSRAQPGCSSLVIPRLTKRQASKKTSLSNTLEI